MKQSSDAVVTRPKPTNGQCAATLLWTKRRWMVGFAACLMAAILLPRFNWMWPVSAVVCLVIALGAHERLRAINGELCRWRDVFDLEVPPASRHGKTSSKKREDE